MPLVELVRKNKSTYWLAEFHGRFDLLFSYVASSPNDCKKFEEHFKEKSRDSISDYQVVIPTKVTRFSKKYIHNGKVNDYVLTSDKPVVNVDDTDIALISLLYENARYTLKELGEKLALTPVTISNRILKLEQTKIILGYRFQLNYSVFGILFFKLLLQLTDYSKNFRDKLFDFCKHHPNITCFIEQVGSYPIEIEVEIADYQKLNEFVDLFREQFDYGLSSCETLMIKKDHLHKFPDGLNT
jgi:DNA-binding Lrp family transcriptional regulator